MTFGNWPEEIHDSDKQKKKMESAASAKLTPVEPLDRKNGTAVFSGKSGVYKTALDVCPCGSFIRDRLPCKHMYRLAYELLGFDLGKPVKSDISKVQTPIEWERQDNAEAIAAVIDAQPTESYGPIRDVLEFIQATNRPTTTIASALEYLDSKLSEKF